MKKEIWLIVLGAMIFIVPYLTVVLFPEPEVWMITSWVTGVVIGIVGINLVAKPPKK